MGLAQPPDGLAGSTLLGLAAVSELAHEVIGAVAQSGDVAQAGILESGGGGQEDVNAAQDGACVAEQGSRPLGVSGRGHGVEAGHADDSAAVAAPASETEVSRVSVMPPLVPKVASAGCPMQDCAGRHRGAEA